MNNKELAEKIKKTLNVNEVDFKLIFQDGYQIFYNGTYVFNLKH